LFSSGLISTLCQDRQGSIWIGTDYGLNKFDGYHFSTYLHDDADTTSLAVNVVVNLFCDRDGRLWVGTNRGLDRYDEEANCFIHYPFPEGYRPRVTNIIQRKDGTLFIATAGYGAYTLADDDCLHSFSLNDDDDYYARVYEDSQGRMWKSGFDDKVYSWKDGQVEEYSSVMGIVQGYAEYNGRLFILGLHGLMVEQAGRLVPLSVDMGDLSGKDVVFTTMAVGADHCLYIGTRGQGVCRLSSTSHHYKLERVGVNAFGINMRTSKINAMFFDRRGNLWLGCHRKGLLQMPQRPTSFTNWSFMAQGLQLGSTISSVCEGDNGMVWCTVQGVGVYGFNSLGQAVAHPSSPKPVEFIFRDRKKRYWIGTDDALYAYDPTTGSSRQEVAFDCDRFNDMTSDQKGRIYISTFSRGFCVYDPQSKILKNHQIGRQDTIQDCLCNNWVMGMTVNHQGLLWLATASGVACYDPDRDSFHTQGWHSLLDGVVCFDVCELQSGRLPDGRKLKGCIAIGTEEGLYLYDQEKHEVERFPESEALNNKAVSYIVQSDNGDLWCSTSQGIWQHPHDGHGFVGHVNGNGLSQREYLYGVGLHTDDDHVFFGHSDGLTVFDPNNVHLQNDTPDSLQLSAFIVSGQTVNAHTVLNGVRVTDRAVSESNYFTLSYLDHTVTMAFSQFNFDNPMNVTFEYRIDEGKWFQGPEGQNSFTLNHLQPGNYRVEVRARVGNDYSPVKLVIITVRAPFYLSTTAKVLYLLVLIALGAFIYYTYRRRTVQQMNEEKMKFLINATHDIRSPLTLIMGPLDKMKRILSSSSDQQPALLQSVDVIDRNAKRILNLVNQILDVRKIDKQQMRLHCRQTDLVALANGICKMFEYNAREHNITFRFDTTGLDELLVWIDSSQFDKVITNLLSNAFKYTQEGGTIVLRLSADDRMACLEVSDTGIGLDPGSEKRIFDRFYQGSNSHRKHINGTGIGLNLCKMIVDMHHGTIEACNRPDGQQGTVFTVTLPLGNSHLSIEEMEEPGQTEVPAPSSSLPVPDLQPVEDDSQPEPVPEKHQPEKRLTGSGGRYRVLIVDDDKEIGNYIATELSHFYKFGFCSNGKEALSELLASVDENRSQGEPGYDIVISDVMMPEMDGFTLLRMIKSNMNISHIPVVMLTSKADVGNRLEGLDRGADAFLAKPFNMDELHGVIDNLIKSRQRLKGKFSGAQQQADKVEQPEVKGNDEQLMERIMRSVNKNLGDSDFSVEKLTQEVGISRAQLHRKMKEMTGLSTSEFVRNIRLEQAARLLREQKINITQVAYTVGFSNLAHFSTIFRKHFGVSPSDYVEQNSKK
jgi:signal transduction histidine kinase/DNA-binding response OmpR family regulator/streptogramin lyase